MVKSERKKERKNPATPLTRKRATHPPTDDGFDCGDFDTLTLTGSEMTRS